MRKIAATIATALSLGALAIAMSAGAEARSGASVDTVASAPIAQSAQDYSGQRRYRSYAPRSYTPRYTPPRYNNAPRYIYPGSRDALDTCAFC